MRHSQHFCDFCLVHILILAQIAYSGIHIHSPYQDVEIINLLYLNHKGKKGNITSPASIEKSINEHNSAVKTFEALYAEHTRILEAFPSEKKKAMQAFAEYANKCENAHCDLEKQMQDKQAEYAALHEEMMKYDSEWIGEICRLERIISLLELKKADDFHHAKALAMEEEREAKAEAARERREMMAAARAEAEERIYREREMEETRRHNREMEQQNREAQAQAAAQQRAAQSQANDAEMRARSAGSAQCTHCINFHKCYVSVRKANRGNCASYRPR